MKIGEKVWMPSMNEIVKVIDVKEGWSSFPLGTSGTKYKIYTLERDDGGTFEYNEFEEYKNPIFSVGRLENLNKRLMDEIDSLGLEIRENNKIIKKLLR